MRLCAFCLGRHVAPGWFDRTGRLRCPFYLSSCRYRRGLMNAFMDEHQLDALAFLTPDYFFYATNYFLDVAPWERPVVTVQPRNGDPFAIMHETLNQPPQDGKERATLWVPDVTLYSEHPDSPTACTSHRNGRRLWPSSSANMG